MRSRQASVLLGAALSAAACQSPRPAAESAAAEVTSGRVQSAPFDSTALAAFAYAAGDWDWYKADSTCLGNTHTVAFSPDRRTMTLTFKQPIDTATGQRVASYRVLAAGSGILPNVPFAIRAAMDGETRRTDKGELVIWDLLLASPNRYHWHRTDWDGLGSTQAIIRCDGSRPLEQWRPPTDQALRS